MRKNIVLSATRQWNVGDEFILFGTINLLKEMYGDFNPIIFNRSPQARTGSRLTSPLVLKKNVSKFNKLPSKVRGVLKSYLTVGFSDNSMKYDTDPSIADMIVFAGSPEWYGYRVKQLYKIIVEKDIPCIFIGIGSGEPITIDSFDELHKEVFKRAKLITTRDTNTYNALKQFGAQLVQCPAVLSSTDVRTVDKVNKIGLIYSTDNTVHGNKVSKEAHDYLVKLFNSIRKKYDVGIVCHYIDEIEEAKKEFPDVDIYYSFDAKDYFELYNNFDMVVGCRVHGMGICSSMGIPGVMIAHDIRSETVKGFKAEIVEYKKTDVDEAVKVVDNLANNIKNKSIELHSNKQDALDKYKKLFKDISF